MKKNHIYCDICGQEIWVSTTEDGYLAKRISTQLTNKEARGVDLEVSVRINGWSSKMDICWDCGDKALQQCKKKLAFEVVGEK